MLHLFILVKLFDKYIKLSKIISDNCFMSIVIIVVLNLKTIHTEPNQTSAKLLTIVILSRLLGTNVYARPCIYFMSFV